MTPPADRRGIKRRLAAFTHDVENLREIQTLSAPLALRTWNNMRPGLLDDPVLNDAEKQTLITLGDSIIASSHDLSDPSLWTPGNDSRPTGPHEVTHETLPDGTRHSFAIPIRCF